MHLPDEFAHVGEKPLFAQVTQVANASSRP